MRASRYKCGTDVIIAGLSKNWTIHLSPACLWDALTRGGLLRRFHVRLSFHSMSHQAVTCSSDGSMNIEWVSKKTRRFLFYNTLKTIVKKIITHQYFQNVWKWRNIMVRNIRYNTDINQNDGADILWGVSQISSVLHR